MRYYTDLDIYGHLSLNLSTDIDSDGPFNNLNTNNISYLRFTSSSPVVTGFADGNDNNKILIVSYVGDGNLTIKNLSSLSDSDKRIDTSYQRDIQLLPNESIIFIYDSTENVLKWKTIAKPNTVKSISGTDKQIFTTNVKGDIILSLPQNISTDSSPTFKNLNLTSIDSILIKTNNTLTIESEKEIIFKTNNSVNITNETDSQNLNSGSFIINGGMAVKKRIQTKNLTVNGVKQRAGMSNNLTSAIVDLAVDDYLIYSIDQTIDFLPDISFNNGTPGEFFYVKIKSDGQQYSWDISNNEIKWPADIMPVASEENKTDLYHFICLSPTRYLGTYVFNYD